VIELKNIKKSFRVGDSSVEILHGVNLSVKKGEFIAIIGQSGSGKSTLMNILGCLDSPSSGSYLLDGQDISKFSGDELAQLRRNKFGFIFQRYNLLASMSALANVALPSVYAGVSKKERESRAMEILSSLELADKTQNLAAILAGLTLKFFVKFRRACHFAF